MSEEKIYVTKSYLPPIDEYINEIKIIWENHWLTNQGILHQRMADFLKEYLGVKYITLFTNGHLSLEAALQSLNISGEVITTPFTFASTTHSIIRSNLKPVFCDINLNDYTIDTTKIESLITEKTSAILPVHVYGNPCCVDEIEKIAQKYNLKVIYDAAHAFGVKINNKPIGQFGDISMFSFHATKIFNTIEGGALVYSDKIYEEKFNLIKNFGILDETHVKCVGFNAKMNEFQAAMGLCNLRHIEEEINKRKFIYHTYYNMLKDIDGIKMPVTDSKITKNYSYFPIVITDDYKMDRDSLFDLMAKKNIFARKYFYPLVTDFDCYKNYYDSNKTPNAKYISERVICLPIYGSLNLESVNRIINIIQ